MVEQVRREEAVAVEAVHAVGQFSVTYLNNPFKTEVCQTDSVFSAIARCLLATSELSRPHKHLPKDLVPAKQFTCYSQVGHMLLRLCLNGI